MSNHKYFKSPSYTVAYRKVIFMKNPKRIRVTPPGPKAKKIISKDHRYIATATKTAPIAACRAKGAPTREKAVTAPWITSPIRMKKPAMKRPTESGSFPTISRWWMWGVRASSTLIPSQARKAQMKARSTILTSQVRRVT